MLRNSLEGGMGLRWGEVQEGGGIYADLWLIHLVRQKPTQYCEAIIL